MGRGFLLISEFTIGETFPRREILHMQASRIASALCIWKKIPPMLNSTYRGVVYRPIAAPLPGSVNDSAKKTEKAWRFLQISCQRKTDSQTFCNARETRLICGTAPKET